jgi:hypothetical protein
METTPRRASRPPDHGLERLRRDLMRLPAESDPSVERTNPFAEAQPIDYAAMEFEMDRLRKRLAIWEIFMAYVRDGARTWSDVQQAMTPDDLEQIVQICDGVPLRDVLLHLR